ncbi:flagellar hook-length control protein FliK [Methylophaga pinxianii]|uniref:flagellar hook-length control protein FliK n=1 Tax=Methylophaga pinxianii TaxID=2881052 RepID=UPI001CF4B283|nr:flagellar hook-length control protein FliK [Methylophaga pinxianii]MCB2427813.1 flagellar hook-length control protein FliK [Methylophaga pinxianii]UPH45583.1 flagellar hook-length control protein FliK [Methylophaga pinxianii]
MPQQLILPSMNVATNTADKAIKSKVNSNDNEVFASELDRRVNEAQSSEKEKASKTDAKTDTKQTEKTDKAENTETEDGKKLPSESTDKTTEKSDTDPDSSEAKEGEDVNLIVLMSDSPTIKTSAEKKTSDVVNVSNVVPQSVLVDSSKSSKVENTANSIRADILQAIQKQSGEGEIVVNEKLKSMMENVGKMPQPSNMVSAEIIASMRQLDVPGERSSTAKLTNPLVFSTTLGTSATPVVGATSSATPALSLDIQPQLNNSAWSKVMSSRVVWMAREGVQQAELRLNPAHLGPVEVRLSMQNDQTNVTFIASNAAARDALEQALPRLRESFTENGLALNHAEVSHQQHSSNGSAQDEQLADGHNSAQVIVEVDDIEDEAAQISADSANNSVGVSVFA